MVLSRREMLRALGASASVASLGPLASCVPRGTSERTRPTAVDVSTLRQRLRGAAGALQHAHGRSLVTARVERLGSVIVDASDGTASEVVGVRVCLGAMVHGRWRSIEIASTAERAILRAAESLGAAAFRPPSAPTPVNIRPRLRIDPRDTDLAGWIPHIQPAYAAAREHGDSRVIYRGAYLEIEDSDVYAIGTDVDVIERQVRSRAGVVLVARAGELAIAERAENTGALGLEVAEIDDAAIAAAADRGLALLHARRAPDGEMDIILAPDVASLLAHRWIADAFRGDLWAEQRSRVAGTVGSAIAAPLLHVVDDPSAPSHFGSYAVDDEGWRSRPTPLIEAGITRGPLTNRHCAERLGGARTGHGRRSEIGTVPAPGHVSITPGEASLEELVAGVDRGVIVEGALGASVDAAGWRGALRGVRAREIRSGRYTGRLFDRVLLAGDIPTLLASIRGVGAETSVTAVREAGQPPLSRQAPHLLLRAELRGSAIVSSLLERLVAVLTGVPEIAEYTASERRTIASRRTLGPGADRLARIDHAVAATVYSDTRDGRGEARLAATAEAASDFPARARTAADAARHSVGLPWQLPPPAAPAHVDTADPAVVEREHGAADAIVAALLASVPSGVRVVGGHADALIHHTSVATSTGFASGYVATELRVEAALLPASARAPAAVVRVAGRRLGDLHLADEVARALSRWQRRDAPAPTSGRYDLILRLDALAPSARPWALLSPLVAQADGTAARLGLTRYRPGVSIHPGERSGDPLSLWSSGARPHALLSAPFADGGEPVRRFPLVSDGIAAGLALDHREAALVGRAPNGGVRNLELSAGSLDDEAAITAAAERPVLDVAELTWLDIGDDGRFSAGLGTADQLGPDAGPRRGGVIAGDVFELLARTRFARQRTARSWYEGPVAARVSDVLIS